MCIIACIYMHLGFDQPHRHLHLTCEYASMYMYPHNLHVRFAAFLKAIEYMRSCMCRHSSILCASKPYANAYMLVRPMSIHAWLHAVCVHASTRSSSQPAAHSQHRLHKHAVHINTCSRHSTATHNSRSLMRPSNTPAASVAI